MAKPTWTSTQSPTQRSIGSILVDDAGEVDLAADAVTLDRGEPILRIGDRDDLTGDAEAHAVTLPALSALPADASGSRDRRLSERQAAVVGRHLPVREHGQAAISQGAAHFLQQHPVLERATGQGHDGLELVAFRLEQQSRHIDDGVGQNRDGNGPR